MGCFCLCTALVIDISLGYVSLTWNCLCQVEKNVFVVFYSGERAKNKVLKICEAFGANRYPFSEEFSKQAQMITEVFVIFGWIFQCYDMGDSYPYTCPFFYYLFLPNLGQSANRLFIFLFIFWWERIMAFVSKCHFYCCFFPEFLGGAEFISQSLPVLD